MALLTQNEQLFAFQPKLHRKAVNVHSAVDPRNEKEKENREGKSKLVVMGMEEQVRE